MNNYLVIDVGGTDIKFGVVTDEIDLLFSNKLKTPSHGYALLESIKKLVADCINQYSIVAIGISCAGIIDPISGKVLKTCRNIKDFQGISLKEELEAQFNIPCFIDNDVKTAILAETEIHKNLYKNIFMMTIGTGIGGAISINGQVIHGSSYTAGEIGLMKIPGGYFENLASQTTLIKKCKKVYPSIENGEDCFSYFDKGDQQIRKIVIKWYKNISVGISNISWIFNPDIFIIGGGITNRATFIDELLRYGKAILNNDACLNMPIVSAHYKNNAGLIGACYLIKRGL